MSSKSMQTDLALDFIYARKSSEDKSRQVASIPDQLEISKLLAEQNQSIISEENIITDSKTGMIAGKRPGFVKLLLPKLRTCTKARIFCWKPCRLARNSEEGGILVDLVRDERLTIITKESGIFNSTNFNQLHNEFGYNSKFSYDIRVGVKRNNNYKVSKGIYPARSSLGYMFDPSKLKGLKDHIPNPRNWDKLREWIEMMLTGKYTVEESLAIMTAKGLIDNKGGKVSKTKAYIFFRDVFYTGLFKYKGEIHQGIHKPLMTMAEYKKIQAIIDKRSKNQNWGNPLEFQGIEILKCGGCGSGVTGEKHKRIYKNGKVQWFYHYRCTKKHGSCDERYLNAATTKNGPGIDDQIKSYINEMETIEEYTGLIRQILKRRNEEEFQQSAKNRELQTKRLADIDQEKKALYGMKAEGFYDNNPEEYAKKKAELLKKELLVKQEIMPDSTKYWSDLLDNTCNFVLNMKRLFENGDSYTRQLVLRILGSNLTLKDKKLQIEAKTAFIAIKRVQKDLENAVGSLEPVFKPSIGTTSKLTTVQYRVRESNP